jgi:hypothetical protein
VPKRVESASIDSPKRHESVRAAAGQNRADPVEGGANLPAVGRTAAICKLRRKGVDSAEGFYQTSPISMRPNLTPERASGIAGAPGCGLVVILLGILPR